MSEELNYKRQCPFCDGVIDFDIDYCESYEIGEDTVNLWGSCNKCDYDGRKEFQAWGGGWQKAEKEIERYKTVEPTINTFEDLAKKLGVEITCPVNKRIIQLNFDKVEVVYDDWGRLFINSEYGEECELQQAYNIINCLKENLSCK